MKCYGIIGYPLSHSFSKKYFTEKFLQDGIAGCVYEAYPIKAIDELTGLLKQNPGLLGLNITIPYKQSIFQFIDDTQNIPAGLKACNCIKIIAGKIIGYNTDITGFERSLLPLLNKHHTHALILGNGGAAEAIKFVLQKLKINYQIVSRQIQEGSHLTYTHLDEKIIKQNTLIINTTPLGSFPAVNEYPDIPYRFLTDRHLLFDLVYNPAKTLFLQKGEEQGTAISNGYQMLVIQAAESWKIWNKD